MFAVVRTGGKQYRVAAGDKIVVEKIDGDAGSSITLGDVLLAGEGSELKSVSGLSVAELAQAVSRQEAGRLTKVPGIGKKTAERLLLELKGKLGPDLALPAAVANDAQADILQALVALGYSEKDAAAALKALPPDVGVSDGIKLALKKLS